MAQTQLDFGSTVSPKCKNRHCKFVVSESSLSLAVILLWRLWLRRYSMSPKMLSASASVLLVGVVAGCGGGSSATGASGSDLSPQACRRHPRRWGRRRQLVLNALSPSHSGKTPHAAARQMPRPLSLCITAAPNVFRRLVAPAKTR